MSSLRERRADPTSITDRARSNGWVSGQHIERDKERALNKYESSVLAKQDGVLDTYVTWCWDRYGRISTFDECRVSALRKGAPVPELYELKDFWRFYKDQSVGRLSERPTARTLRARAKEFKAGFMRYIGNEVTDEDTEEINYWLKNVLLYEEGSGVKDIEMTKFNYKPVDLDRNLKALWARRDVGFTYERTRIQFHFLLLLFCDTGARRGGFFKDGIRYKDVYLVLARTSGGDLRFFFNVD